MDRSEKIILLTFLGIIGVAFCLVVLGGSILLLNKNNSTRVTEAAQQFATATEFVIEPTSTPVATQVVTESTDETENETLKLLQQTNIPATDLVTIAEKFKGKKNIPLTLSTTPIDYQVGDTLDFWVLNVDTNSYTKVTTHLAYKTSDVYFWIAYALAYNKLI
jgi:hypothetical protein